LRAFIDTSSLIKKYIEEEGAEEFNSLLESVSEIIVSPVTILEVHSAVERRLRERTLKGAVAQWIEREFLADYDFFGVVEWNDELITECLRVIRKYQLRVLDGIQLAAALISRSSLFITSDKRLFEASNREIQGVKFI
jgi:uncharacterized protein